MGKVDTREVHELLDADGAESGGVGSEGKVGSGLEGAVVRQESFYTSKSAGRCQ